VQTADLIPADAGWSRDAI